MLTGVIRCFFVVPELAGAISTDVLVEACLKFRLSRPFQSAYLRHAFTASRYTALFVKWQAHHISEDIERHRSDETCLVNT